jgi:hypothetical protein
MLVGQSQRVLEQRFISNAHFHASFYRIVRKSFHLFQQIHCFQIVLRSLLIELPEYLKPYVFLYFVFFFGTNICSGLGKQVSVFHFVTRFLMHHIC